MLLKINRLTIFKKYICDKEVEGLLKRVLITIIMETNLSRFMCGKVGGKTYCREVILSSIFSLPYKAIP